MFSLTGLIESAATLDPNTLATVNDITAIVTPFLPLMGTIIGGVVIGAFAVWNRKRGAVETRAPDVNEIWQQQHYQAEELDREIRIRRRLERYVDELIRVFRGYVRRVQLGGDIHLTNHERLFHDTDPPTSETPTNVKN
jgi:hypothetical protein